MHQKLFLLIGALLSFSFSLFAQPVTGHSAGSKQQNTGGETYAIVAGISSYYYIRPLNYADQDADLLPSAAGGG